MAIHLNTNISSLVTQRYLGKNTGKLSESIERLSSGYKINSAGDDAAGLTLSTSLTSQIVCSDKAVENIQTGSSMLQIAESHLSTIEDNLQRIRNLTLQAANITYSTSDKEAIINEIQARIEEINRVSKLATFNNLSLLNTDASTIILQIGTTSEDQSTLDIKSAFGVINATTLGVILNHTPGTLWLEDDIQDYIKRLDSALEKISVSRAKIGAFENRLESAADNLTYLHSSLDEANSAIIDTDVAEEASNLTRYQILQQCSVSVLSQTNQLTQTALSVLQGL